MIQPNDPSALDIHALAYVESLYEDYVRDPASVSEDWQSVFSQQEAGEASPAVANPRSVEQELIRRTRNPHSQTPISRPSAKALPSTDGSWMAKQGSILRLIQAYRTLGHVQADIDPIRLRSKPTVADLHPETFGFTELDQEMVFNTGNLVAPDFLKLREILDLLQETYTRSIGIEYMHISDMEQKNWLMHRSESTRARVELSAEERQGLLASLVSAEGLERYLHRKFSGKKRFSLEGGESFIPLVQEAIQQAGSLGVNEVVIGMAHRGRLNLLTNVMGKAPNILFQEFGEHVAGMDDQMTGDVKYHQGFSSDVETPGGLVHLALAFNPSHLEIINPVICGSGRARMERAGDHSLQKVLPFMVHGDAAISGQGVAYESLQMSQTRGYAVGGTLHVVINNQIGFTTSHPRDARSSLYCTDIGKVTECPIFHVNGDDPEAVIWAVRAAVDFRMKFHKDVFIDLVCFRRHGHNEGDEPSVTQPHMYRNIRKHSGTAKLYAEKLDKLEVVKESRYKQMVAQYRDALDEGSQVAPNVVPRSLHSEYYTAWQPYLDGHWDDDTETSVTIRKLKRLGREACKLPIDFSLHPGVRKLLEDRQKMIEGDLPVDWGCAETLAYATLLDSGFRVRISGQDSGRGTFFHRHAVMHDYENGRRFIPLRHLAASRGSLFTVVDSILSEEAVLGFEYGYSMTDPATLVIWEAQYGDFANGAQVLIDQFISSSQQKWNLFSGLVMMLPHGWEGQGPEHSSARLERFLQLCAQENLQVVVPSSAAQMFHVLRRQMMRKLRIPLIIMSPKSMLRKKEAYSTLKDFTNGEFQTLIPETDEGIEPKKVTRVVLCSGKLYYELVKQREESELKNVAILRLEQLYPFDHDAVMKQLSGYPKMKTLVWSQEEPMNQGAWYQIRHRLQACVKKSQELVFAGRVACSAPAGGSVLRHNQREQILIHASLGLDVPEMS
jgi:2-oxoglutarate dehydrogenase E1 component